MESDSQFVTVAVLVILGLIAWRIFKARQAARTPEALARKAEVEAAKQEATAAMPAGWTVADADRERYGAGQEALVAYGAVATGPGGEHVVGIGLTQVEAYRTVARALRGDVEEAGAWAPPIPPLTAAPTLTGEPAPVALPAGWTLQAVDRESYFAAEGSVQTYGAIAFRAGGERAIAVARERQDAIDGLIDRIEGRLEVSDTWAFRVRAGR